ncbi:MAG: hypothetical protein HY002_12785 [Candidatus Rokubacteria bacterium]|nr:hypothetical protein [Candidatus Rokubacteria bacterium]
MSGFAVNPADPKVMYATMRDGLFRSTDAGQSWAPIGKGLKNLAAVALNPRQPSEVYAVTADGVIHRSADGGTTWARR